MIIFGYSFGRFLIIGLVTPQVELSSPLPDTAPFVPMETKRPKQRGEIRLASRRDIEPNPFAERPRQPCPQVIQNRLGRQLAVGAMPDKIRLRDAGF